MVVHNDRHLIVGTRGNPLQNIIRDLRRHTAKFQLWQPESHPIQLMNNKMAHQKLDYIHNNPVEAGFVIKCEEWKYAVQ